MKLNDGGLVRRFDGRITIALFLVAFLCIGTAEAQRAAGDSAAGRSVDSLVGKPVGLAAWAYTWRSDRAIQEEPEAYFIPRRLERIDHVYRTAYDELPEQELKSIYYDMPDLLTPLPLKPERPLQTGLLWRGGLSGYQVTLHWPADAKALLSPEEVEVRVYPTSWGWFGWTVDKVLDHPELSADGHTWTYRIKPGDKMDSSYSNRVDAATEMVAVFYDTEGGASSVVPTIEVTGPSLGEWERTDIEIEWGFQPGTERSTFDGNLQTHVALTGPISSLPGDNGTTVIGEGSWKSTGAVKEGRRGIMMPVLYAPNSTPGLDSRITVWRADTGFTFRVSDLEAGPILIPEHGVFITKAGRGQTAKQFAEKLERKNLKSISQMTRSHREASSWNEVMQEVRWWRNPAGTVISPFPQVKDPTVQVQLPDEGWTAAWRAGAAQLKGTDHMWGGLANEVARSARAMDLLGMHDEADKVYTHFFKSPGVKADGDYVDANGALEWATSMRHDMGYSHDGTHASTGRLLDAMAERYFRTGDNEWFQRNRARMQAAADWIIRQRKLYLKDIPNREKLSVAGLMPPAMVGDYALPTSDWHWYFVNDAFALQGLQRFADALVRFDSEGSENYQDEALQYHADIRKLTEQRSRYYLDEAESYRQDIIRVVRHEAALSPVRLGRDGKYHTYISRMAYARGLTGPEIGSPQFPNIDFMVGAMPLAEPFSAFDANDSQMASTLDLTMEMITPPDTVRDQEEARKKKGLSTDDAWFWRSYVNLPKISHNANIFLLQDDVPNFLRYWMNAYATMVGADGVMWEHWHLGNYTDCEAPDNGTAAWFMENFRNLLVMEDDSSLWVARATPRAWLQQGKRISVENAPTYFGNLTYEIVSDVNNGKINATVEIPERTSPRSLLLRFRHPKALPIKQVMVNGQKWKEFDGQKEVIELAGLTGKVTITAVY